VAGQGTARAVSAVLSFPLSPHVAYLESG